MKGIEKEVKLRSPFENKYLIMPKVTKIWQPLCFKIGTMLASEQSFFNSVLARNINLTFMVSTVKYSWGSYFLSRGSQCFVFFKQKKRGCTWFLNLYFLCMDLGMCQHQVKPPSRFSSTLLDIQIDWVFLCLNIELMHAQSFKIVKQSRRTKM